MNDQYILSGLHVLIVEDAFLVALDLSEQLRDRGCSIIGPASTVEQALQEMEGIDLDGAILDVNLGEERSFPVAERLASRGIPFIFLTGYDGATAFPDEFSLAPRLTKPVDLNALTDAVAHFRAS